MDIFTVCSGKLCCLNIANVFGQKTMWQTRGPSDVMPQPANTLAAEHSPRKLLKRPKTTQYSRKKCKEVACKKDGKIIAHRTSPCAGLHMICLWLTLHPLTSWGLISRQVIQAPPVFSHYSLGCCPFKSITCGMVIDFGGPGWHFHSGGLFILDQGGLSLLGGTKHWR